MSQHNQRTASVPAWQIDDARALYRVKTWGEGYFDINERGAVTVTPKAGGPAIDLDALTETGFAPGRA